MPEQPYQRPPITEAVIGIRFADPIDSTILEKAASALKSLYPTIQILRGVQVQFGLDNPPQSVDKIGYRLTSTDLTQMLSLLPEFPEFTVSQLAPYPGWDAFFGRFRRDWTAWKAAVGYRKLARVGVRYINRIDIPMVDPIVHEDHFLNVYPHLPEMVKPMIQYAVQTRSYIPALECVLTLNSSVVPSPLIKHMAFVLDLDMGKDRQPPQNDNAIYELINRIRVQKNQVFEACITEQARELFEPWPE